MKQEAYNEIDKRLKQLMADASLIASIMRQNNCTVHADNVLAICTTAGSISTRWEQIEPDWNAPASDDCHTNS